MTEKYLTLQQNTCAARIFLNFLGLILENITDVNEFSKIKIFDKDINEVGELHFDNGKVMMFANYNNSMLEASFDIAKMSGFVDRECGNALFGQWRSKINFAVQKENSVNLNGEFLLDCSVDSEFGVTCRCHSLINCEVPNIGKIILKNQRDGSMFRLEVISQDNYEVIDFMPFSELNGFIRHDLKRGKYDKEKHYYPYRRYAGIFGGGEKEEIKDKLHVFLTEEEDQNNLAFRNEFIPKVENDNSRENLLQKGMLMQQLDPDMYDKIKKLREVLAIGDVSLLDNLISICYDSYTDEELSALLGIKRQRINYQDGSDSLVNSYYGIGKNSCFFPLETQKRIIKKK